MPFEAPDTLLEQDLVVDRRGRKSVWVTTEGIARARALVPQYLGGQDSDAGTSSANDIV